VNFGYFQERFDFDFFSLSNNVSGTISSAFSLHLHIVSLCHSYTSHCNTTQDEQSKSVY